MVLKSDPTAPKTIINHPGVEVCLDGLAHGVGDSKWYVQLKPQWKFSQGHAEECTTASFDRVSDFKFASPVPYVGRLTR